MPDTTRPPSLIYDGMGFPIWAPGQCSDWQFHHNLDHLVRGREHLRNGHAQAVRAAVRYPERTAMHWRSAQQCRARLAPLLRALRAYEADPRYVAPRRWWAA